MKNVSNKEKITNISIWQNEVRNNLAKNRLQQDANASITRSAKVLVDDHKRAPTFWITTKKCNANLGFYIPVSIPMKQESVIRPVFIVFIFSCQHKNRKQLASWFWFSHFKSKKPIGCHVHRPISRLAILHKEDSKLRVCPPLPET